MLKEERFEIILNHIKDKKKVTYENLALEIKVSEDTIRRDIDILHRNGLLSKVRGGAITREKNPLSFDDRESFFAKEKNIIALKAQQFIKSGMTVFMDGGTTICAVGNYLPGDIQLRVVTNNYSLIPILAKFLNIEIIVLGGKYETELAITSGVVTCMEASNYIADLFIMGTCAVDAAFGITAVSMNDAETKKTMLKHSKKVISLANQNKLRRAESFKVCAMENVDVLITDLTANDLELDEIRQTKIQII